MTRQVKRAFKYRFHPTGEQAAELSRTFGCVRLVYNKALEERSRASTTEGRKISYVQSSALLTDWKRLASWCAASARSTPRSRGPATGSLPPGISGCGICRIGCPRSSNRA
jgi:transposase